MIVIATCVFGVALVIAVVWWNDRQQWAAYWRNARSPATVAKCRLKHIIAADRQAVPCGRWELSRKFIAAMNEWVYIPYGAKPRYQWQVRR